MAALGNILTWTSFFSLRSVLEKERNKISQYQLGRNFDLYAEASKSKSQWKIPSLKDPFLKANEKLTK